MNKIAEKKYTGLNRDLLLAWNFGYTDQIKPVFVDLKDGIQERYTVRGLKKAVTRQEIELSTFFTETEIKSN